MRGGHGACANPIFDLQNRRVQFWLRRPHFCQCFLGCWASVGTILGSCSAILGVFCGLCWPLLGKSWDHIGLILGHFGLCWDILGHVGTILGSCWVILGYFRICGLCFGLGHFSVVDFSSMQACAKNTQNTRKQYNLWTALLMVFAVIFWLFLFLSWGMLQLGYVCLISGLCWAIVGYVGTILGSCWAILLYSVVCVCLVEPF